MLQMIVCLALIGLGMGVDATYQRRIRIAECDAYETGYQYGLKESMNHRQVTAPEIIPLQPADEYYVPSMGAPVAMPQTAEERLRTHGRATWRVER